MKSESLLGIRFLTTLILLVSVFIAPGWVSMSIALIATCFFSRYYELFIVAASIDIFFGTIEAAWIGFRFWTLVIAIITFFIIEFFKKRIR